MAWTAPSTVTTNQLMTAAFWNQDVRDNQSALRTGGIAVASQATGDLLAASASDQVGRVAAANGIPYYSGGAWSFLDITNLVYPVGYVYVSDVSTNPGTLFGGTWVAFGAGRVTYGIDGAQTEFDTVEETGGAKTHTITTAELPVHGHGVNDPGHFHEVGDGNSSGDGASPANKNNPRSYPSTESKIMQTVTTGITVGNAGSGGAHTNLAPYQVAYMFKRTA